jgi:hypothetical protein
MSPRLPILLPCLLIALSRSAPGATWYVATNGSDAAAGTNWITARQTIQAAIDGAGNGDTVLVSNGLYATGGRVVYGAMTNRVALTNGITVRSLNGPAVTIIAGQGPPGDGAVRCAYIASNSLLAGFTLTGGATRVSGDAAREQSGGGVRCDPFGAVSNCWITGNAASYGGGFSAISTNSRMWTCRVIGNAATVTGGGVSHGRLANCLIAGNSATYGGGFLAGPNGGRLDNCTLVGNTASVDSGGAAAGPLYNCIVVDNSAPSGPNYYPTGVSFTRSCTTPPPGGTGNITNDPQFVDAPAGNFRLRATSPCIDLGDPAFAPASADLDGQPRIVHDVVDMGAYEFQGYWSWAAAIGNGLTNYLDDAVGDGYPNLLRYAAGSAATNGDGLAHMGFERTAEAFRLWFHRNTNAVDVTLTVQESADLRNGPWVGLATNLAGSWGSATAVVESAGTNPVEVRVPESGSDSNRYLRLLVTKP